MNDKANINSQLEKDERKAFNGVDEWTGTKNADEFYGGNGADILNGAEQKDIISGGNGSDMIYGGTWADTIDGGNGDDWISAGLGRDTLTGGRGADTFYFDAVNTSQNQVKTVTDFEVGKDLIDVSTFWDGYDESMISLNDDGDVVITINPDDNDTVVLTGVDSVSASDFLF